MADYWIKGDDGEEYGPAPIEELAEWIEEDRAGLDSLVRTTPDGEWKPLQTHPELLALVVNIRNGGLFPGQPQLVLAPFLPRILAYGLDVFLVGMVAGFINVALPAAWRVDSESMYHHMISGKALSPQEIWFLLGTIFLYILYFTLFHATTGQTPGKRLCRIRVVDAHGLTVSYWTAFVRAVGSLVSQMPYYAGFFIAFVTPNRRTLHDFIARTYVVSHKPPLPKE